VQMWKRALAVVFVAIGASSLIALGWTLASLLGV